MNRGIGALALVISGYALLSGCATQRVADGDHLAPSGTAEVFYEFLNADSEAGAERTALVFVHGWACDHQYWAGQVGGMTHDRAMLAVDLPGYGRSTDGDAEHSMNLYAESIAAAMDDAGIDRAVLVGHSMGTPVIRQFERLYPGRTAGLIVVDGFLQNTATPEQAMQRAAPLFSDQWQEFATRIFEGMSAAMAHEDDRALVLEVVQGTSMEAMRGGYTAMNTPDIWNEDPIGAPLMLVLADAPFWTEDYKAYVRTLSPGVRFVVIEGVSHFLMLDDPEGFNRVVEEWLEHNGL